ncbi:MAG: C2H2-type zinc finger protein [Nitrososphaeria archaeon]
MSFKCSVCGKKFKDEEELLRHLRSRHKDKVKLEKLEHPEHKK